KSRVIEGSKRFMNHKKHLRVLLQTYLRTSGESDEQKRLFWFYLCGWIPESAAAQVFRENGLTLSGNERPLYEGSYLALRRDTKTEHLEDKQLNEAIGELCSEVISDDKRFKNQA